MKNRRYCLASVLLFVLAGGSWVQATPLEDAAAAITKKMTSDPAAAELKGKVLVISKFAGPTTGTITPGGLQTKLIASFVNTRHFKIVERDQLDKALRELNLASSPLVDPGSQKQLGSYLSADLILVGEISSESSGLSIDARLVSIETSEIAAAVSTRMTGSAGFVNSRYQLNSYNLNEMVVRSEDTDRNAAGRGAVRWLVEDRILAKDISRTWSPEIDKAIYSRPERYVMSIDARQDAFYVKVNLTQLLRDLSSVLFGTLTPRVAVITTEQVIERQVPDPAVQTSISAALLKYGFQVLDVGQARKALEREQFLQVANGDADAFKLMAAELDADIIIKGESFAEQHTDGRGFDARVEFAVVEGTTGRVLASISDNSRITDVSAPLVAAKTALQEAADGSTLRMCSAMLNAIGKPVTTLRVYRFTDFEDQEKIINGLKKALPGGEVTPVSMDLRASKCAVFSIGSKRQATEIASALKTITGLRTRVTAVECRSVVCEIQ